jgi:hypothetical protein
MGAVVVSVVGGSSNSQIHHIVSFTATCSVCWARNCVTPQAYTTYCIHYILRSPALQHAPVPALRLHQVHALVLASHHFCMSHRLALLSAGFDKELVYCLAVMCCTSGVFITWAFGAAGLSRNASVLFRAPCAHVLPVWLWCSCRCLCP